MNKPITLLCIILLPLMLAVCWWVEKEQRKKTRDMNPLKKEIEKSLTALFLELPETIATDVKIKFENYSKDIEEKLLQATRNLGHPAYEHSAATHEYIDNMRETLFDLLDVPKKD